MFAGLPVAPAVPTALHTNEPALMPDPPALSAALTLYCVGLPTTAVVGPMIVPVGGATSGVVLARVVTASTPPAPPIATCDADAAPTACQASVASAPSAALL